MIKKKHEKLTAEEILFVTTQLPVQSGGVFCTTTIDLLKTELSEGGSMHRNDRCTSGVVPAF